MFTLATFAVCVCSIQTRPINGSRFGSYNTRASSNSRVHMSELETDLSTLETRLHSLEARVQMQETAIATLPTEEAFNALQQQLTLLASEVAEAKEVDIPDIMDQEQCEVALRYCYRRSGVDLPTDFNTPLPPVNVTAFDAVLTDPPPIHALPHLSVTESQRILDAASIDVADYVSLLQPPSSSP